MRVDPEAGREAVVELRARTPVERWSGLVHQDLHDGLDDLAGRLVAEHGLGEVIRALTSHRADHDVAELLFHVFWANHRNMSATFSEAEIVEARSSSSRPSAPARPSSSTSACFRAGPGARSRSTVTAASTT